MLRLKQKLETPPDNFRYKFPDGFTVSAVTKQDWFEKIRKYADDNQYPVPSEAECEDQLCRSLSGEWCDGGTPASFINIRLTLNDVLRGAKVLAALILEGGTVSQEVADARALICSRCFANLQVPGCSACTGMANAVVSAKGGKSTKHDHLLKTCGICLCPNQAQVWVQAEHLAKGVTPEMLEQYKQIEPCWKKDALLALSN